MLLLLWKFSASPPFGSCAFSSQLAANPHLSFSFSSRGFLQTRRFFFVLFRFCCSPHVCVLRVHLCLGLINGSSRSVSIWVSTISRPFLVHWIPMSSLTVHQQSSTVLECESFASFFFSMIAALCSRKFLLLPLLFLLLLLLLLMIDIIVFFSNFYCWKSGRPHLSLAIRFLGRSMDPPSLLTHDERNSRSL